MEWQRDAQPKAPDRYRVTASAGVVATANDPVSAAAAWSQYRDAHPTGLQPWIVDTTTERIVTRQAIAAWAQATGRDELPPARPDVQPALRTRVTSDLVDGLRPSFLTAAQTGAERRKADWNDALAFEVSMRLVKILGQADGAPTERLINDGWQVLYACGLNHRNSLESWRDSVRYFTHNRDAWNALFTTPGDKPRAMILTPYDPQRTERVLAAVDQQEGLVLPVLRRSHPDVCWQRLSEVWMSASDFTAWREDRGLRVAEAA